MGRTIRFLKPFMSVFLCICTFCLAVIPAYAYEDTTLYNGLSGEKVRELQLALISLGYLDGSADGIFGNKTENAVRKFQKKNKLDVDGLAGITTQTLIFSQAQGKQLQPSPSPSPAPQPSSTPEPETTSPPVITQEPSSDFLFGGNYTSIRFGNRGDRVKTLQKALISAGFLNGKADGIFGNMTLAAVKSFQRSKNLVVDGIAGRKTLSSLESALKSGSNVTPAPSSTPSATPTPSPENKSENEPGSDDINEKISAPSVSLIQLLHWVNDIKPSLSNGQHLLIYDPASGLSWTLRILSRGRHCDAEPLTAKDTRTMLKAFGNVNTWNQKPVYVLLPGGIWTIGSTHDMPHQSGSIKDNDFNGHLCVHFLRDMDEAKKNDPNYGVSNQETIRTFWKKLTGQDIDI